MVRVDKVRSRTNQVTTNLDLSQLEQVNDSVNVSNLLLFRYVGRLSEQGGKDEGFTNRLRGFVDIHLADVSSGSLERSAEGSSVNLNVAVDDTVILSKSENIEKCRLAGATVQQSKTRESRSSSSNICGEPKGTYDAPIRAVSVPGLV